MLVIVIRRRGHNDEIGIGACGAKFACRPKIQFTGIKEIADQRINDGRLRVVYHIDFFRDNVNDAYLVTLGEKAGDGQPHVPCTHYSYLHSSLQIARNQCT